MQGRCNQEARGAKRSPDKIFAPKESSNSSSAPLKFICYDQFIFFFISPGENFLKCYSEYAITSGIAISVSINRTTTSS